LGVGDAAQRTWSCLVKWCNFAGVAPVDRIAVDVVSSTLMVGYAGANLGLPPCSRARGNSGRYERHSTLITSNLEFSRWTEGEFPASVLGSARSLLVAS
jgi:hypothetical protein